MDTRVTSDDIAELYGRLEKRARENLDLLVEKVVRTKEAGGKVVVVTGSGPNMHEGVTTLIAELIHKHLVDGVITSSAVIAHEMAGALDRVKRVNGTMLPVSHTMLPRGEIFEITVTTGETLEMLRQEMEIDLDLINAALAMEGPTIIKAAGNMGYPVGLRTERIAALVEDLALREGLSFEAVAGFGADPMTMIGAGAREGIPVLVSVPQLIGGGAVGLSIADSLPVRRRSDLIAQALDSADVIIESGIALSQEIHDGPFETYTGHGIWSAWDGIPTYSLSGKTLARIDLDPALEMVWKAEREDHRVQSSIDAGLPKTKTLRVPFRMEMSGFARIEGSIPIVADLGVAWPVFAWKVAERLKVRLDFVSAPQETPVGRSIREWIVDHVALLDRSSMLAGLRERRLSRGGRRVEAKG